jgi:hypothetical protein
MLHKIARVMVLSVVATVLPGVIVACSAASANGGADDALGSGSREVTSAAACTNPGKHDDAKCTDGYTLLDEINDESCSALNDAAEDVVPGGLTLKVASSFAKGSPGTFSWG